MARSMLIRGLAILACRSHALLALTVLMGLLSACATQRQAITRHEDKLSAAGFLIKPANTPERQQMLNRLPPHQFVRRINGDEVHYVYADPLVCGCLYVGSQDAYNQFQRHEQEQHIADQQQVTAQTYSDAAWNWGAWGPWGPGFRFRYGPMGW